MKNPSKRNLIAAVLLVTLAVVSCLPVANLTARPESYAGICASIDEKAETVLKLTATSTIASAAVSAIPDDTATPIAEKLADFTEYFLLILCVLYAEKYLLSILGLGVFRVLIPVGCVLYLVGLLRSNPGFKRLAVHLAVLGLTLFLAIPASIWVSDQIYDTYSSSIAQTISDAGQFSADSAAEKTDGNALASVWDKVTNLSGTVTELTNKAASIMNRFIEAVAVMIVTSCVIPLLVLLFFLWLVKLLTGADLRPQRRLPNHSEKKEGA